MKQNYHTYYESYKYQSTGVCPKYSFLAIIFTITFCTYRIPYTTIKDLSLMILTEILFTPIEKVIVKIAIQHPWIMFTTIEITKFIFSIIFLYVDNSQLSILVRAWGNFCIEYRYYWCWWWNYYFVFIAGWFEIFLLFCRFFFWFWWILIFCDFEKFLWFWLRSERFFDYDFIDLL